MYNFNRLGISPTNIHILVGYNAQRGLRHYFQEFIEKHRDKACFFSYPDNRIEKKYLSSLRPHIIRQHLLQFPDLENKIIFYHDSDIIFRELPDFNEISNDNDSWYVSDTRNYLDSNYIKNAGGEDLFNKMCEIVGISPQKVIENDINCGGAQYLLKNTTIEFWSKVEKDSEALFAVMKGSNSQKANWKFINSEGKRSEYHGIQVWCADMWAVLWNALLINKRVEIHRELEFCWADSPIENWHKTKILHYTGYVSKNDKTQFRKTNYIHSSPYYDTNLKNITDNTCSYPLATLINEYIDNNEKQRIDLTDVSFLIPIRIESESRLENLFIVTRFINKFFETNIFIIESDKSQKIDKEVHNCNYEFIMDNDPLLCRTRINNLLIKKCKSQFIAIYDADVIFPICQIIESVEQLRVGIADAVCPYDGSCTGVDSLFKTMFAQIIDPELFTYNLGKFVTGTYRSCGGAVFINTDKYIKAGMENEYIASWGPEDIERVKRMKNLGYKVKRIEGHLFHLPHERKENSRYSSHESYIQYMEEYLKVCNMNKAELEEYIGSWPWTKPH
jgi:hypothetical protein